MSVQPRQLQLVSPSEATSEMADVPTVAGPVSTRKGPASVDTRLITGEVVQRPKDTREAASPWSFINEIESHVGLYTVAELAVVLQRSTCSIYRMAHRKQLPSLRVGGLLYFDPAALGMFFRKKSPESAAAARFRSTLPPARFSGVSQKDSQPR